MTAEQAFGEMVESLMKHMGNAGTGCRVCIGTVKEVDEKEGTCVVERDDAPELNEVRLNAVIDEEITDRFMVVPAKGSFVMVLLWEATEGMIVATSKIEKVMMKTGEISVEVSASGVVMNGGKLGGMIDIAKLTEKVNTLVDALNNHTHLVNTTGSASAQSGTAVAISSKVAKLKKGDYEDEKVKH